MNEAERDFSGLHFATNYRGGISVADCIKQAREVAMKIQSALKTKAAVMALE
ncbi:MAG: hypothetical protein ACRENG_14035 [bacterium]